MSWGVCIFMGSLGGEELTKYFCDYSLGLILHERRPFFNRAPLCGLSFLNGLKFGFS